MILMRGYEPKYQHERDFEPIVSGGRMWHSNNLLHFTTNGKECDIENAPFNFEDLMLSTNMKINSEFIFEKDILLNEDSDEEGFVYQNDTGEWVIEMFDTQNVYNLKVMLEKRKMKLTGNILERADNFIAEERIDLYTTMFGEAYA